jgi:hypothetical protein
LENAKNSIRDAELAQQRESLLSQLEKARKSGSLETLNDLISRLIDLSNNETNATHKRTLKNAVKSAKEECVALQQHEKFRESITKAVDAAFQSRDLEKMAQLIEEAKSQNIAVKSAKKYQRIMMKEESIRLMFRESFVKKDKQGIESALEQACKMQGTVLQNEINMARTELQKIQLEEKKKKEVRNFRENSLM